MKIYIITILLFLSSNAIADVSKENFKMVIRTLHLEYYQVAKENNRNLKFFTNYESDWAQAFARRWEDDEIHLYGGFAKIKNANEDSLALIICHELGHLYAGAPYSNIDLALSVEGRADYWAASECMPRVISKLPHKDARDESLMMCSGDLSCARILDASLIVTAHFAKNQKLEAPQLTLSDPTIVDTILKTHPSPQCRLDLFRAGALIENYPHCFMPIEK